MSTFIIAEAGVNHNGDEGLAVELVKIAAASGADAVKFQTFSASKLCSPSASKADYQKAATGNGSQIEMLRALEMSHDLHRRLADLSVDLGIEFMSTAFDAESLDFLIDLGIKRVKIPSGELTNTPFLRVVASKNLPIILSTGMATLDEVQEAISVIDEARRSLGLSEPLAGKLTILHCTSNYPAELSEVNLLAIGTLQRETQLPVGYSDHTLGATAAIAAVAVGAKVIEKHFTLDKKLPGPDHAASLEPGELEHLVRVVREVETALGDGIKVPSKAEQSTRAVVRRSIVARIVIPSDVIVREEDVEMLRPGTGIPPRDLPNVLGRRTTRTIAAGELLSWSDLK
jgi:N,N'-diacetyllegionaminate synthase